MTSFQEISEINFSAPSRLMLVGKRLSKSNKQSSKITAFLSELFFLFEIVLCLRNFRAIKARAKRIFKKLGIPLQYPMHDLPARCESIRSELVPYLLDHLELGLKNYLRAEREIEKMKTEAQEAKMPLLCRKLDNLLTEIDELIAPLQDVKQVLSAIYGPERTKIDSLNKKIAALLSA